MSIACGLNGCTSPDPPPRHSSPCAHGMLQVVTCRLFLLLPLLDALGIPLAVICDQLMGDAPVDTHWCVERLMDAADSRASITEAVASLTTNHLFRTTSGRLTDQRVKEVLDCGGYGQYRANDCDIEDWTHSVSSAPQCSCAHTSTRLRWDMEFGTVYDSLASFLLAHQCHDTACVGCTALTTAILDHADMAGATKTLNVLPCTRFMHSTSVPILRWDIQTRKAVVTVKCLPASLLAIGRDLTPFIDFHMWDAIYITLPAVYSLRSRLPVDVDVGAITQLARVLDSMNVTAIVRHMSASMDMRSTSSPHGMPEGTITWPPHLLFAVCRSEVCWPLLGSFVLAFLNACTRELLVAQWRVPESSRHPHRSILFNLFGLETLIAGRSATNGNYGALIDEVMPILYGKLLPSDFMHHHAFRGVCAMGSLDAVERLHAYVKDETYSGGFATVTDAITLAIEHNTAPVCAFLLVEARNQAPGATVRMLPVWGENADTRGDPDIRAVFAESTMAKSAV